MCSVRDRRFPITLALTSTMKSLKLPCLSRPELVLGSHEILTPIGAGGMGEVYRTRDTKLTRDVAIKVLPAALSNDADYMARFQREAQVLAALNHPNIAAIYDLEDHAIVHGAGGRVYTGRADCVGSRADRVSSARRQTDRGNPRSSP